MSHGLQSLPLTGAPTAAQRRVARPLSGALRFRTAVVGLCLLSGAVLAIDALLLEPNWIEVRRSVESLPGLPRGSADLTLVHLSDLHVTRLGYREREAVRIVNDARPDLIVITGDLVSAGGTPEALREFLGSLEARYGKFLVWGNHDYWDRITRSWGPESVRAGGFTLLCNDSRRLEVPGGIVRIAGVDDPVTGRDDARAAMAGAAPGEINLLLAHSPEIVRTLPQLGIERIFAGHTHGGQIRLPWVGALWIPFGTRDYVDGWYDLNGGARLHVNRGLGTSWLPVRFLCRPCIDVIILHAPLDDRSRSVSIDARDRDAGIFH